MKWFAPIRKNAGFSLFVTNVVLLVSLFLLQDPFEWIRTGYAGAAPLVNVDQSDVTSIEVEDPENRGARVILLRADPLPGTEKEEKGSDRFSRLWKGPKKQFSWN